MKPGQLQLEGRKWSNPSISQALEHLNFERNDNMSNTGKSIDQLSFRVQLAEGLFVKYGSAVEHKVPGRRSSDNTVPRLTEKKMYKKDSFDCKEIKTAEMVCCVSEAGE
jgi:hypothetical protein